MDGFQVPTATSLSALLALELAPLTRTSPGILRLFQLKYW